MSTNSECLFIEYKPGQWFYILEDYHAPKNAWDWMEYATAYGPFASFDTADTHLQENHANPGGYSTHGYREDETHSESLERLIKEAHRPVDRRRRSIAPFRTVTGRW